jgi:hypothetical protein
MTAARFCRLADEFKRPLYGQENRGTGAQGEAAMD